MSKYDELKKQNKKIVFKKIIFEYEKMIIKCEQEIHNLEIMKNGEEKIQKQIDDLIYKKQRIEKKISDLGTWFESKSNAEIKKFNKQNFETRLKTVNFTFLVKNKYYNIDGKLNHVLLAHIIEFYFPVVSVNKTLYMYNEGMYKEVTDNYYLKTINTVLGCDMKNTHRNETLSRIYEISAITLDEYRRIFEPNVKYINFNDCFVEFVVDDGKLKNKLNIKEHTPNIFFKMKIDVNFKKNKHLLDIDLREKTPALNQYLQTSLNDNKERALFMEISGSTFLFTNYTESLFFVRGNGGNGKGLWDRLLKHIIGDNYCNPNGNELTGDKQNQFTGLEFIDSYVAFTTEINKNIKDISLAKKISGLDELNFQLKHSNARIKAIPPSKIFLSLNENAKIYETEDSIKRRCIFIKMGNKIKVDKTLEGRMRKEKTKIFFRMFQALLKLLDRGHRFDLPDSHFELAKTCWESNDNFINFINNHIEVDKNCRGVAKNTIFQMMNYEFGDTYKNRATFFKRFEDKLKEQDISIICEKRRWNKYIHDMENNEWKQEGYTATISGYKYLQYVDSKVIESEEQYLADEQNGKKFEVVTADDVLEIYNMLDTIEKAKFKAKFTELEPIKRKIRLV